MKHMTMQFIPDLPCRVLPGGDGHAGLPGGASDPAGDVQNIYTSRGEIHQNSGV